MKAENGGRPTVAPFVLKTYKMVSEPETDGQITWGRDKNSFVVLDPFGFAQNLLPSYFKHNNFSSFVRQLNTYGFRKVDSDCWEFAHESFLKGQTHLLQQIARRNSHHGSKSGSHHGKEDGGDLEVKGNESMAVEVARLKQEQKGVQEELRNMWKRIQETERQPKQMLAFLVKVVENPDLIPRLQQSHATAVEEMRMRSIAGNSSDDGGSKKRGRLMISNSSVSSSSTASDEWAEEQEMMGSIELPVELGLELGSRKMLATEDRPLRIGGAGGGGGGLLPLAGDAMDAFGSPSMFAPDFCVEMDGAAGSYPLSFPANGSFY